MAGSVVLYKELPKIYRATTLILVQPQEIPTSYVQSTVTLSVTDRLATISQQIMSRTSLEQVIRELHLVKDFSDALLMDGKVQSMREAIKVDVRHGGYYGRSTSSFSISYMDPNPVDAARIVNRIASLFITENLRVREDQARGTSRFLEQELLAVEKKLNRKEEEIRIFKEHHMGELPAQLDANLGILRGLQDRLRTNNESIIAAQQNKANIENQIDQITEGRTYSTIGQIVATRDPLLAQLDKQERTLQELLTQYTEEHPDVIGARASIRKLEAEIKERRAEPKAESPDKNPISDPTLSRLNMELQKAINQIESLGREQAQLKNQIELYQGRVENIPRREEQMSTLLRDYTLLQHNYQSLLDKRIQAQLAENLEKRQKGEQFKILDPATPPVRPFKPDTRKIFGFALILGLGLGGGLAYLQENMDRAFHKMDDVEEFLGISVIATIPRIENKKSGKRAA